MRICHGGVGRYVTGDDLAEGEPTMTDKLPLSLRDMGPGPNFSKAILGLNPRGLPEGVHTGGPWVERGTGEYWKPLDCRPFVNATFLVETEEGMVLDAVSDIPGFPRNWRIEERNGRRWLVRPKALLAPTETTPTVDEVLKLESGLIAFNRRGYLINDHLVVGRDPENRLFFVDLSCASKGACNTWDEESQFMAWLESLPGGEIANLVALRRAAGHLIRSVEWMLGPHAEKRIVYAWRGDGTGGIDADAVYIPAELGGVTWVVTGELLPAELVERHDLTLAWRKWLR